ncbi:hypothetical protein KBX59_05920 [Lentilactobacillus hilgardii]|nr:hypothetical protein [Lentilactobacillus hilgardii]MCP9349523.1 hypothetical protein [Lentilactobacillus hilgardii]MCP9352391.1 hypothetical protein [Lentilactobacillus hilgardii]
MIVVKHKVLENKVPAITMLFWVSKLISTMLGESASDFSSQIFGQQHQTLGELFTVGWSLLLFIVFLYLQIKSDKYHPIFYWNSVGLLAVFGTFSADTLKGVTGLHYVETTLIFFVLMIGFFVAWYATTKDLSIHHITSRYKEAFYWLTVAATFMLGTAAGDWFATARSGGYNTDPTGLGLGFLNTGVVLGLVFLMVLAYRAMFKPKENGFAEIASFWFAYILTRPIGASFADYFGYNFDKGILGNQWMTVIGLALFMVAVMMLYKNDQRGTQVSHD